MAYETGIEWAHSSWSPWYGCDKVSTGCLHCYAGERWAKRTGRKFYGKVTRARERSFMNPTHWKEPRRIFVCSLSDFWHPAADAWRPDAWRIMEKAPQHTYLLLTKRSQRITDLPWAEWSDPWPNVWIGVSVEAQRFAYRLNELIQVNAAVRFVSAEPLLGPLTLLPWMQSGLQRRVNWVVVGGESGGHARPMRLAWARAILDECRIAGVPFFMKQLSQCDGADYKDFATFPAALQVREYPDGRTRDDAADYDDYINQWDSPDQRGGR